MAKVVTAMPSDGDKKYAKYFDGQPWRLELGKDCPSDLRVARTSIYITAKRLGIECEVRQSKKDNCIYVQAKIKKPRKPSPRDRKAG